MSKKNTAQLALSLALLSISLPTTAALTEVSSAPLLVSYGVPVKPNVMLILDNSGSMDYSYLPEAANNKNFGAYVRRAAQCNGLAFDPAYPYELPLEADGSPKVSGSIDDVFDAAVGIGDRRRTYETNLKVIKDGTIALRIDNSELQEPAYAPGMPVVVYDEKAKQRWMVGDVVSWNARTMTLVVNSVEYSMPGDVLGEVRVGVGHPQFVYFEYSGSVKPARSWVYYRDPAPAGKTAGAADESALIYKECHSTYPDAPGSGVFRRKIVTRASDLALRQKLANWWAYHSTRMKMMKTIVSRAFMGVKEDYRLGFSRISDQSAAEVKGGWLSVRDFDQAQKSKFYNSLFAAVPSGTTPLREAMSLAGQYFAKKAYGQTDDPIQYSCQKNFVILSSDGGWNSDKNRGFNGPYGLDGKAIGDLDGAQPTPYRDSLAKSNTLADTSLYYYSTDLRDSSLKNCSGALGKDVCANEVQPVGKDDAKHQHLTTFTLSLGQNGVLKYCDGYETACANEADRADFVAIQNGSLKWPDPYLSEANRVDDFWHAAVNGRGTYFNASDPAAVARGLKAALSEIQKVSGSGASGATSSIEPVQGDNLLFIGRFTSGTWAGDLRAHTIDLKTGRPAVRESDGDEAYVWSAAKELKAQATRKIFYAQGGSLKEFSLGSLESDGLSAEFNGKCSSLSQYASLSGADQLACNRGENMVAFVKGREFAYFRSRNTPLGDIVGSAPMFDGKRGAKFSDEGYSEFKKGRGARRDVVYVGANDGMVHAFDASKAAGQGGKELWAFIPSAVRSRLYKLADQDYGGKHEFFVDGPSILADVKLGKDWRSVLVGGLGAGGRSYYALDVTDQNNPKLLWEFTDPNLGLTHAKPVVTKRKDGTWVVAVSSGFNNNGDGKGHLFLIDLASGAKLVDIATPVGDAGSPSGLGPLVGWVESKGDNTSIRYYAGDNEGNLWRFDTEGLVEPKHAAHRLAYFKKDGKAQPITVVPKVAELTVGGATNAVVFVGTGRLVGKSDLGSTDTQSIYAVKDLLSSDSWGDYRALLGSKVVAQTVTNAANGSRKSTNKPVIWTDKAGWGVDLPDAGERINVPMNLVGTTLVAASNIPKVIANCEQGNQGTAWLYFIDIATGAAKFTHYPGSMLAGTNFYLIQGKPVVLPVPTTGDLGEPTGVPTQTYSSSKPRRANWREVMDR